jgi:plasmid stabilization system protein ParE
MEVQWSQPAAEDLERICETIEREREYAAFLSRIDQRYLPWKHSLVRNG